MCKLNEKSAAAAAAAGLDLGEGGARFYESLYVVEIRTAARACLTFFCLFSYKRKIIFTYICA